MSGRGPRRASPRRTQRRPSQPKGEPRLEPRWGFHRLSDGLACQIVRAAGVKPGDLVVDIGAGDGALTRPLVEAGARVIAVELHPGRLDLLKRQFAGTSVTVVSADALALRWPRRPFRVVANPPYAVWAGLLRQLLSRQSRLVAADLVLQRRVVRQIVEGYTPRPGAGGGDFVLRRGLTVSRSALRPAPRVDSAVLVVRRGPVSGSARPR